jgi:hypothetical protein
MKSRNIPKDVDPIASETELDKIRHHVHMDHVLAGYERLAGDMIFVHPSQLKSGFEPYQMVPERFLILLPSPFHVPDDDLNSVVVFLENNLWEDFTGVRPKHIPNDIFGFVMAYEHCSHEEAVAKLSALADQIRQEDQEELERHRAGLRSDMDRLAEHQVTLSEASRIRGEVLRRLSN